MSTSSFRKKDETKEAKTEIANKQGSAPEVGACIVTKSILDGTSKLKWIFRENNGIGTGWVAFGDTDTQEYIDHAENLTVVDFHMLANIEPAVWNIFYMPVGADLEFCSDAKGSYFIDTRTGEEIREPVKHPVQIAFEKNLKFLNQKSYDIEFFQSLFSKTEKIQAVIIGQVYFPTGRVVVADPLAYLGNEKYQTVLEQCIPKGSYDVELSICYSPIAGLRIAAARLKISDTASVRYELAMPKGYSIEDVDKPRVLPFVGVDTGLACFADESTAKEYTSFLHHWYHENENKNLYHDYFLNLFQKSYEENASIQTKRGDFLIWNIPKSENNIAMFSSGMGDGIYSCYWGFDKNGDIAELVVPFINPEYF